MLIRGKGHSGTTILDLILSCHSKATGIGEGIRVLRGQTPANQGPALVRGPLRKTRLCSCGQTVVDCPLWGPMTEWLKNHDDEPLATKLAIAMQKMASLSGPDQYVVDSSQSDIKELPSLAEEYDVRVIFLVRDVRSWVWSRLKKTGGSAMKHAMEWAKGNRDVSCRLAGAGVPFYQLGYEELALRPMQALESLCRWLDLEFEETMLAPSAHSQSHVIVGNKIARQPGARDAIVYDASWMASRKMDGFSILYPLYAKLNRTWVYSNGWVDGKAVAGRSGT